jgi:integrase
MEKLKLTKTSVEAINFHAARGNQQFYWDDEQPGFGLRVTSGAKAYVVESRVNGKTCRLTLGRHGKLTAEQARRMARQEIGRLAEGIDPRVEKAKGRERGVTLQAALEAFIEGRRKGGKARDGLKDRTIADYRAAMRETFDDWMTRPITSISATTLRARYAKRVKESPARANNAMRVLRAVLRDAAAEMQDKAVKAELQSMVREAMQRRWAKVERRNSVIAKEDLGKWIKAVLSLHDPVVKKTGKVAKRRKATVVSDYLMFCLLTGCRREEAAGLKWSDVDLNGRTFTLRDTKNRLDHTLPMTDWLAAMFDRRKEAAQSEYVFPGAGKSGRLVEPRKVMAHVIKASGVEFTIHDLRRTFASIAEMLGVGGYTLKRLMNHKTTGDVTAGYVVLEVEDLRAPMQKITDFVLTSGGIKPSAEVHDLAKIKALR